MAEQLLNGAQVGAFAQHVCAEGMAQGVWMYVRRQPVVDGNLFYNPRNAARRQRPSPLVDKKLSRIFARFSEDFLPHCAERLQYFRRHAFQWNITLLLSFAADQNY